MTAVADEVFKCQLLVCLIICDTCFPIFYWTASSRFIELRQNLWEKKIILQLFPLILSDCQFCQRLHPVQVSVLPLGTLFFMGGEGGVHS